MANWGFGFRFYRRNSIGGIIGNAPMLSRSSQTGHGLHRIWHFYSSRAQGRTYEVFSFRLDLLELRQRCQRVQVGTTREFHMKGQLSFSKEIVTVVTSRIDAHTDALSGI